MHSSFCLASWMGKESYNTLSAALEDTRESPHCGIACHSLRLFSSSSALDCDLLLDALVDRAHILQQSPSTSVFQKMNKWLSGTATDRSHVVPEGLADI